MLVPEDMRSSEPITSPGVIISIEVIEPQTACSGLPVFSDVEPSECLGSYRKGDRDCFVGSCVRCFWL
jgi:hypothetical protein